MRIVSAYYLSNVEQYLGREGLLDEFCANAAQLPLDAASTFIRSVRNSTYGPGIGLDSVTANMLEETKVCAPRRCTANSLRQLRQDFSQALDFLTVLRPVALALRLHCALVCLARL